MLRHEQLHWALVAGPVALLLLLLLVVVVPLLLLAPLLLLVACVPLGLVSPLRPRVRPCFWSCFCFWCWLACLFGA